MRVLAALSGGVDSAVAAALVQEAGADVTAVHLALSEAPGQLRSGSRGCCSVEDSRDARRVADVLDVPFYVWDLAERFRADVVDDFVAEYAAGRTPNPCLRCNERIKFSAVLDRALALGFDAVVTGHHARLVEQPDGSRTLHRSVDAAKDQSYVLGVLTAEQLAGAHFPLGGMTKDEVRAEASRRGLTVADKPDSYDVCFVADGNTRGFLADRLGSQPGDVVDAATGDVLGRHDGAYAFTIGQRRGLDLRRPAADGRPRYVLSVEPVQRRVVVGPGEALDVTEVDAGPVVWCGAPPGLPRRAAAQLRAHGEAVPCCVEVATHGGGDGDGDGGSSSDGRGDGDGGFGGAHGLRVFLDRPVRGVAAGQAVVLYDGDRVLGSATVQGAGARAGGALGASGHTDAPG